MMRFHSLLLYGKFDDPDRSSSSSSSSLDDRRRSSVAASRPCKSIFTCSGLYSGLFAPAVVAVVVVVVAAAAADDDDDEWLSEACAVLRDDAFERCGVSWFLEAVRAAAPASCNSADDA